MFYINLLTVFDLNYAFVRAINSTKQRKTCNFVYNKYFKSSIVLYENGCIVWTKDDIF